MKRRSQDKRPPYRMEFYSPMFGQWVPVVSRGNCSRWEWHEFLLSFGFKLRAA